MPEKVTAPKVRGMKAAGQKIVCVTAYDAQMARLVDDAGVDIILVGDSVGNVLLGYSTTIPVTLEDMLHHTRAVSRGVTRALLVADMPFGSYQGSEESAVNAAVLLVKAGAHAVKLEGNFPAIAAITKAGIPVMGHVGLTPQSVHAFGGFKLQGKGSEGDLVLFDARAVEAAGAFGIVLELVPAVLGKRISDDLTIPTIGIGAGPCCDGQVQVLNDLLGFTAETYKHVKRYAELGIETRAAVAMYAEEVRQGKFPAEDHSF